MAFVVFLLIACVWWVVGKHNRLMPEVQLRGSGETLTIAATGDWVMRQTLPFKPSRNDAGVRGVADILKSASLGVANLEENLLDEDDRSSPEAADSTRWPYGTAQQAKDLRTLGISVVSLANNHATDYGTDGMRKTQEILRREGLWHVGTGEDLQEASRPVKIGVAPRCVAVIAFTTSAPAESRATETQGEILGRPGVNVLRYSPAITLDSSAFATLKGSPIAAPRYGSDGNQLTVAGQLIRRGKKTEVEFTPNGPDMKQLLSQVEFARSECDVVVAMLHSHEPDNRSQVAADFVESVARSLIDAGASLVVGTGPHQLRGIEVYKRGAIFYSLGDFAYDYRNIDTRAADVYDAGTDLFGLALGATIDVGKYPMPPLDESVWWESLIAVASFHGGVLESIRLRPIDLGVKLPNAERGIPRTAGPQTGSEILEHLTELSAALHTHIRVEDGSGVVDLSR